MLVGDCKSINYVKADNNVCYRLHTEMLGFWEAESRCQVDEEHLISFTDSREEYQMHLFIT